MVAYVMRRILAGTVMMLVITFVTFVLFFSAGSNPAVQTCGKSCSPALIEQNRKAIGYDKPVPVQWEEFLKGIVGGRDLPNDEKLKETVAHCDPPCLGYSPLTQQSVTDEVKAAFPVSFSIAIMASSSSAWDRHHRRTSQEQNRRHDARRFCPLVLFLAHLRGRSGVLPVRRREMGSCRGA